MITCQICAREIKAKFGMIAHHGYTRPYDNFQTQSCMGARNLPYEKSREIIPKAIESIKFYISGNNQIIEKAKRGEIAVPSLRKEFLEPTDAMYNIRRGEYIARLEFQNKRALHELERLQKRYDDWRLPEETK
jgi:hypothetical protein